jgi:hypothetical protein
MDITRWLLLLLLAFGPTLLLCDGAAAPFRPDRKLLPASRFKTALGDLSSRNRKDMASLLGSVGRASQQLAVHISCGKVPFGMTPRIVCLSGIAACAVGRQAIQQSEASQRALLFWKRAGPIVVHYKFTEVKFRDIRDFFPHPP